MAPRRKAHRQFFSPQDFALAAGLDEAGRGCLAGPVVAAAVILPDPCQLPGLADSKQLSPKRRQMLAAQIRHSATSWALGVVWAPRIDEINILNASLEAMAKATGQLKIRPQMLLIDGLQTIPDHCWEAAGVQPVKNQQAIVRGDALVPAISAASILAKTFRDHLMLVLARKYPGYCFEKHKGYGTKEHFEAIRRLGPSAQHRRTFSGVLSGQQSLL